MGDHDRCFHNSFNDCFMGVEGIESLYSLKMVVGVNMTLVEVGVVVT